MWKFILIPVAWLVTMCVFGLLKLGIEGGYYAVRRYPCPACGEQRLRFLIFRSNPWVESIPGPLYRYGCEGCGMEKVDVPDITD
jgi:hypothetical protein